jgi:hypothetical protein
MTRDPRFALSQELEAMIMAMTVVLPAPVASFSASCGVWHSKMTVPSPFCS